MPLISNITALPAETASEADVVGGPLPEQLLGDRYEYWADDTAGLFYAKIPDPEFDDQNVIIRVKENGITLEEVATPYDTATNRFSFQLDVESLSIGDYSMEVLLLNFSNPAEGGMSFGGNATSTFQANEDEEDDEESQNNLIPELACEANQKLWCEETATCTRMIWYREAYIPAITVCDSSDTVTKLTINETPG